MNYIIELENLSKKYRISLQKDGLRYCTLRDELINNFRKPFLWLTGQKRRKEDIWPLKNVSFKVKPGEILGIIGPNGAGKTTLLKVLTRITPPTEGKAIVRGRIGSLLEVGTGFHPELTGRENIYLNGAILGMRKKEIDKKFDEIVDFSGVEKFLDTPLKRYSAGMNVRLAFSIAVHLDSEILLIDEVLAVGDVAFQKKCLKKMESIAKRDRTVLFVSHNMSVVSSLCNRAILLRDGKIAAQGSTSQVISEYLSSGDNSSSQNVWSFKDAPGFELVKLRAVRVFNEQRKVSFNIDITESIDLEIEFWCLQKTKMCPSFHLYNQFGALLFFTTNLHDKVWAQRQYEPGLYRCSCRIPANFLNEGTYFVNAYLSRDINQPPDICKEPAVSFRIQDSGSRQGSYISGQWLGLIRPLLSWETEYQGPLREKI